MYEHISLKYYNTFFKKINELLKEKGKELQGLYDTIDVETLNIDNPYPFLPEEEMEPFHSKDDGEFSEEVRLFVARHFTASALVFPKILNS